MSATEANSRPPVRVLPVWLRVIPFFLSALFFYSTLFSVFSPIPLFVAYFRGGFPLLWACLLVNSCVVVALGALGGSGGIHWLAGLGTLGIYAVFVGALSLSLPYFLYHRKKLPDRAIVFTFLTMAVLAAVLVVGYGAVLHTNPLIDIKEALGTVLERFLTHSDPSGGEIPTEELKRSMLAEFPSLLAVFGLVMVWINLVILVRLNPHKLRETLGIDSTYLKTWKSPDWLVWPTIAAGATVLFSKGVSVEIGANFFKFFLAVYGLQGISILSYFFDQLRLAPLFKTIFYVLAVFFMTPLVIALGFFDLWFDFRSKLRQS